MSKYLATTNVPGYSPMDDDPPTFDTAREAWEYLASERMRAEDDAADLSTDDDETEYSDTFKELDGLGKHNADAAWDGVGVVYGDTPGYDGDHDLGLAYSVTLVEDEPEVRTIKMNDSTKRFYQGVASASEVLEAHADVDFPDFDTRIRMFWFYVGVMAAGEHGCQTESELTNFVLGAATRAPHDETEED